MIRATILTLLLPLSTALAADGDEKRPSESKFTTTGDLRWIGSAPPDFVVDKDDNMVGQGPVLDQRIRLGGQYSHPSSWSLGVEGDIFTGQIAGDAWDLPGRTDERDRQRVGGILYEDAFTARRAALAGRLGPVQMEAGLVTSDWGLGMVANSGARDPIGFGRSDFGDRVLRLRLTTAPFQKKGLPLYLTLAGDRVVADEVGTMADEQQAWQGVFSALYATKEGRKAGIYGAYRHQTEANDVDTTKATVIDATFTWPIFLGPPGHKIELAAEGARILGTTSRIRTYNNRDEVKVDSAGLTGHVAVVLPEERAKVYLRGGWASGDGNPDDGSTHDFTFDRDYDVGMLLFDEYLGGIAVGSHNQLTDPENSGQAPDGVDGLVTDGAVKRAAFFAPQLGGKPVDWLHLKLGYLMAWSTAPIAEPYMTFRNGGVPANHLGETTEGYKLGDELDWAVGVGDIGMDMGGINYRPQLLVQGAHLFPTASLAGADSGRLDFYTVTARLRW